MNSTFFLVGVVSLSTGVLMMLKHKFFNYKSTDMLFASKLRVFLASAVLALFGVLLIFNELKKLI
jgi:hypothetical protein